MPLAGWICPTHGEEPGRNNPFTYCINKCSNPCVAPHVLEALRLAEEQNYHTGKRISVTMLTGSCKRQTVLERILPFYIEPEIALPAFRGALIHSIIEQSSQRMKDLGWLIEFSMALPIQTPSGSWTLTARLDAFDPQTSTIYDIKTLQEYAVQKLLQGKNPSEYSDYIPEAYIKQSNIYKYMGEELGLFTTARLRLQVVTFGGLILTGTTPTVTLKSGSKWNTITVDLPDIPIVDKSIVKNWIETEGEEWYKLLYCNAFPPVVSAENAWMCKRCSFNGSIYCPDPQAEIRGQPVAAVFPNTNILK